MQREVAKTVAFTGLILAWTYFRIYLSLKILWSVWFEFDLIPYVIPLLSLHASSFACVQGRVHAVGTTNRSLACTVDEIPGFRPFIPSATPEPLLVFLDLKDCIPVCRACLSV